MLHIGMIGQGITKGIALEQNQLEKQHLAKQAMSDDVYCFFQRRLYDPYRAGSQDPHRFSKADRIIVTNIMNRSFSAHFVVL